MHRLGAAGAEEDPAALRALLGEAVRTTQAAAGQAVPAATVEPRAPDLKDPGPIGLLGEDVTGRRPRRRLPERVPIRMHGERRQEIRAGRGGHRAGWGEQAAGGDGGAHKRTMQPGTAGDRHGAFWTG